MTSFSLNFFSNQIQCSHVFLIIQFPESSNLKQSYFIADETRDFPCIAVLLGNFKSAPPVFRSALVEGYLRPSSGTQACSCVCPKTCLKRQDKHRCVPTMGFLHENITLAHFVFFGELSPAFSLTEGFLGTLCFLWLI